MSDKKASAPASTTTPAASTPASTMPASTSGPEYPQIVVGHEYHKYGQSPYGQERYAYQGKNDDGQPEFVDYGPKDCRK